VRLTILTTGFAAACLLIAWHRSAGRLSPVAQLRELGWAAALLVVAAGGFGLFSDYTPMLCLALALASLLAVYAPALPRVVLPWLLLASGLCGFVLAAKFSYGRPDHVLYGTLLDGLGNWARRLAMPLSYLFAVTGAGLVWARPAWRSRLSRLVRGARDRANDGAGGWSLLLVPLVAATGALVSFQWWTGIGWAGPSVTVLLALAGAALAIRTPQAAADLAVLWLLGFAVYGVALGFLWPSHIFLPPATEPLVTYGAVFVDSRVTATLAGAEGAALLALGSWLAPRTVGAHVRAVLADRPAAELASRVQQLTETRTVAVDSAAAELRRIERDLHDGAQARLVALGMNLRALERLIPVSPEAAVALAAEARESSSQALAELRDLVRGIYPPVLADRGLADAVQALALDLPLRVEVDIDLAGRPEAPVESACYFAVAEALTNVVRHAGARCVQVRMRHSGRGAQTGLLRIEVSDDGTGGADPAGGTGLAGVEKRLATFDGILAISSPPGGPTVIAMEVPCALSSPRTSSS
jgi:signal transduction histidine kinase